MTRSEILALTAGRDMWSTAAVAGAPSARMADGPMGIASGRVDERDVSVLTPSGVSLGATWDTQLVRQVGALVGGEAKRQGVDMVLAPNLNLARSPLAGRAFELFSEDPLLAGTLGAAWIGGLQSRHVGSVAKHLVCNDSETLRDSYDAVVDQAALREVWLLPFEMAVAAGCAGLLTAYNKLNGTHCAEHPGLLTTIVRDDWKFSGFTVSDWFGTVSTAPAMNAGLDLEMPGPARFYGAKLDAAITAGETTETGVAAAAERVAAAARRWAGGDAGAEPGDRAEILRQAAAASFVLLRNRDGLLPFAPGKLRRIALIGPNAIAPCFQGGTFAKVSVRPDAILPLDALRARFGADTILFAPGADASPRLPAAPVTPAEDIGDGCTQGMTVSFFDGHDFTAPPLARETRDTNSLTWFSGMPGVGVLDRPAGVRAAGWFVAGKAGIHRFHIGGTGAVTLRVDGRTLFAADRAFAPGDIMGVLKSGESDAAERHLEAGQRVLVEAELRFQPARAQGLWYGIAGPADAAFLLAEAETAAREADAVVLLLGETADSGVESKDRTSMALPPEQIALARRVLAANRNVAIVANVAHAFDTRFADEAAALMLVWYPGEEFGPALADVLAGDREPSGRLPVSFAERDADYPAFDTAPDADGRLAYAEASLVGHRHFAANGPPPRHAFGAGLNYTRFAWREPAVALTDDGFAVEVLVENIGPRAGSEVVQIYRRDQDHALLGFAKVSLEPGEARRVRIAVPLRRVQRWGASGWHLPATTIPIALSASAIDHRFTLSVLLAGGDRP